MRPNNIFVVIGLATATVAMDGGTASAAQVAASADIDGQANAIFDLLKAGKALEAIKSSLGKSPLMAGKEVEQQTLAAQMDAALRIYGPIKAFELAKEASYGTMVMKRFYVVQHEKALTRWEIDFVRLSAGWVVSYIGFEDQVRSWE
jgi:hypothetical protein